MQRNWLLCGKLSLGARGGGLNHLEFTLLERELGRFERSDNFFGRPSGILMACNELQKKIPLSSNKGRKFDALAMTEPGAGSDVRGMECTAQKEW